MFCCASNHSRIPKLRQKHHKSALSDSNLMGAAQALPDNETDAGTDDGQ